MAFLSWYRAEKCLLDDQIILPVVIKKILLNYLIDRKIRTTGKEIQDALFRKIQQISIYKSVMKQIFHLIGVTGARNQYLKFPVIELVEVFFQRSRYITNIPAGPVSQVMFVPVF